MRIESVERRFIATYQEAAKTFLALHGLKKEALVAKAGMDNAFLVSRPNLLLGRGWGALIDAEKAHKWRRCGNAGLPFCQQIASAMKRGSPTVCPCVRMPSDYPTLRSEYQRTMDSYAGWDHFLRTKGRDQRDYTFDGY